MAAELQAAGAGPKPCGSWLQPARALAALSGQAKAVCIEDATKKGSAPNTPRPMGSNLVYTSLPLRQHLVQGVGALVVNFLFQEFLSPVWRLACYC